MTDPERALQRAIAQLDRQLEARPDEPALLALRAKAAVRAADLPTAARCWERAAALHRAPLEAGLAWREAAAVHELGGDPDAAARCWRAALHEDASWEAQRHHLRFCLRHGRVADLQQTARRLLATVPHPGAVGDAHEALAQVLPVQEALPHARAAVVAAADARAPRDFGRRLLRLASLHRAAGDERKARGYLERARPYLDGADADASALMDALCAA